MKGMTLQMIQENLKEHPGWEYNGKSLQKSFEFENFKEAFSVMTRIAMEAEKMDHHPYWENVYNKLKIQLSTHEADGITEKDFALAKTIDTLLK